MMLGFVYIHVYKYIYINYYILTTLTLGGNLKGIMLYYIVNISSSFYS